MRVCCGRGWWSLWSGRLDGLASLLALVTTGVGLLAGSRPGGRGTFLGDQEKYPKEGRPADCVPPLRYGQPVVLGYGLHRETHYAPEALRSNRRGESVHEAVALFGATAQPIPCAPRRIQKGWCADAGHRCARHFFLFFFGGSYRFKAAGRESPRQARYFSCTAKKSTQKKAAPADCVPSLRCGQPVVLGYGLHRETHYAPEGAPFKQTR